MKNTLQKSPIFLAIVALLFMISCQKESQEYIDETQDQETITLDSLLTAMLISASQNNGYKDNIIDGSSCISVKLPVTVVVNDQELIIETEDDYAAVQAIYDEFSNDIDFVNIQFPITIVFEQFNEIQVGSETILNSIIEACQNSIPDTYTCVEFVYPISCFTYNSASEQTGLVTMSTDKEWFEYLNYLDTDILISIDYPMGVIIEDQVAAVNNNEELFEVMSQVNCDQENGIIDPIAFRDKITTSLWYVNLYNEGGSDRTCSYVAYKFRFNTNGTVHAKSDFDSRNGTWEVVSDNDELLINLAFESTGGNDAFEVLNASWDALESTVQNIKLREDNDNNGTYDYLYFGRSITTSCGSGNGQILTTNLIDGSWVVNNYVDNGINETNNFEPYELRFELGGAVIAIGGVYNYYGSWDVNGDDELELVLDFGTQFPFTEFNATWDVLSFDANTVSLRNNIGGTNNLVLAKL